jgi:ribosomal protein S12 methylthiotransferase
MRARIPDLVVRSTFIVGFPNETEENFRSLLNFVEEIQFDHLGVFTYSPEEDTAAYLMEDAIPEEEKTNRMNQIMELQSSISAKKNQSLIGSSLDMLVEGIDEEQDILVGRSYRDAPEIDGLIVAQGSAQVGEMAKIQIESSGPYDLFGSQIK